MEKAYLTPTFHHDIAYLRPEREYTAECLKILDEALYILETNPEYKYYIEQAWLLEEYWDARPEKRGIMRGLAREGRLKVEPGLYSVPDMSLLSGESLFMQAAIGRRIVNERLGASPRACVIADCWGHNAQIPQILTQCGYEYYLFSRCMRRDVDRQNFVWRGADGTKIRAHWMSTHYEGVGFPVENEAENAAELEWADAGADGIRALIDKNREKCGDDPQLLPAGGDMRFPSRLAPKLVKALNARGDLPELVFETPAEALSNIDWDAAPVCEGGFESSQQGSFSANITIKQLNRKYEGELYALEALCACLRRDIDFAPAWKLLLKNQFHDIACGTICDEAYIDAHADYRALGHALKNIRRALASGEGAHGYFNALPFERAARVREGVIKLPALGFAPASDARAGENAQLPALPLRFENEWYAAEAGEDGYINSIIEKRSGRELAGGAPCAFGCVSMQLDYGDNWWSLNTENLTRETQAYTVNRPDPLINDSARTIFARVLSAEVKSADGDAIVIKQTCETKFWVTSVKFTTTITLSKSSPEITYKTAFTNECKQFRLRAAFPVNNLARARRQIPYATTDFPAGEQATGMFMDASDERAGLAVINRGTPAGNIEGGIMLLTLFRSAAMEYKCKSELSFNMGRDIELDYAILPHAAGDDDAVWRAALMFNTPVIECPPPGDTPAPKLEGAYISCLRPARGGMFMRVYNPKNARAQARLTLAPGARGIYLTDGLENIIEQSFSQGREHALTLGEFSVQGVYIHQPL